MTSVGLGIRRTNRWGPDRQLVLWVGIICALSGLLLLPAVAAEDDGDLPDIEEAAERTHMDVALAPNGDATWQVEYRIPLATEADREGFADLQAAIEDDPESYESRYAERMGSAAAAGEAATDREMTVENVTVRTELRELPEPTGVVTYQFTWKGFAPLEDDRLVVGDALAGFFLAEDASLLIQGPNGWAVESVTPSPAEERSNAAFWRGPIEFGTGEPQVIFGAPDDPAWRGLGPAALAGAAVVLGAIGVLVWRRRQTRATEAETPPGDPSLLSNEEQVLAVLEDHGGRMKQQELAETLEWTDAKTSKVTSEMREAGRIEGFRLGRENVLSLPDDSEEE